MKLHYQEVVRSDWFFQLFTLGFQSPQAGGALVGAGVEKGPGGQLAEQLDALGWTPVTGGLSWWFGDIGDHLSASEPLRGPRPLGSHSSEL